MALITALLLLAIISLLLVTMTTGQQLDIQRTSHLAHAEQGRWYGLSAENWAKRVLTNDDSTVDSLHDDWATRVPVMPIEQGAVAGEITDLQGRFNLNNLVQGSQPDTLSIKRFERLLALLEINTRLTPVIVDWIDKDSTAASGGAEDSYYTTLQPNYRTGNQPFADLSELRLLRGITTEIYAKLKPYVTTLPTATAINVNTAPAAVLNMLSNSNQLDIDTVIDYRQQQAFTSVQSLEQFNLNKEQPLAIEGLTVNSNYFSLLTQVSIGLSNQRRYSLLYRNKKNTVSLRRWSGY
ncbi:MAG: type II secretion system minor pseudopilin GspK [Gammaproteobacteria bacterium]|nr:type II secretion system minor pseudopilin GspK [Gammaproteobacteria bacterium]